jgi:eukaryotic-like serine/threonine-protein kinase
MLTLTASVLPRAWRNATQFTPGEVIESRYAIEAVIASSRTSLVLRAHDRYLDRMVAIKTPRLPLTDPGAATRLRHEGDLLVRLRHPHIAACFDTGEIDGIPYFVIEHVDGFDLSRGYDRGGIADLACVVSWARQLCAALDYLHRQGYVHGDVKPQNVLIDRTGLVKLLDFGNARPAGAFDLAYSTRITGSAAYLAPEVRAGAPATRQSDLYALGVLLYRLVAGALPFEDADPTAIAARHASEPPRPPREFRTDLPDALSTLILRLLAKAPCDRPREASGVTSLLSASEPPAGFGLRTSDSTIMNRQAEIAS